MNLTEAKRLRQGQTIYAKGRYSADGTVMRGRVTSIKTWKTRPQEIEVHYKRGMYEYGVINEHELAGFTTKEPTRKNPKRLILTGGLGNLHRAVAKRKKGARR